MRRPIRSRARARWTMLLLARAPSDDHGAGSCGRSQLIRMRTSRAIASSTTETAAAVVVRPLSIWLKMKTDETSVLNGMLPEIRISEPNSPIARAKASATPARMAGRRFGRMILRKIVSGPGAERGGRLLHVLVELDQHRLHRADDERQGHEEQRHDDADPRERDAVTVGRGCRCRRRAPAASGPATIVGSANGRSISELTIRLPGNSSRTRTQAMIVPNTALIGDDDRPRSIVSFSAATPAGLVTRPRRCPTPSSNDRRARPPRSAAGR